MYRLYQKYEDPIFLWIIRALHFYFNYFFLVMFFLFIFHILSANQCTPHNSMYDVNAEQAEALIASGIPIFFRFYFAGCVATPRFQPYWEEAAESFPQVTFVSLDCISSLANSQFCDTYVKHFQKELRTPSHFLINNTQPVENSFFYTPVSISKTSQHFQDHLRQYLGLTPVDLPMIHLTNVSTVPFYESSEFSTFIMYNSGCEEDVRWLGKWANVINESFNLDDSVKFGFLDCSQYEYECRRWGSAETSAIIYKRNGDRMKISYDTDDIAQTVKTRISSLRISSVSGGIPNPVTTPAPTPEPTFEGYTMIKNTGLESRPLADVKAQYLQDFPRIGSVAHSGDLSNCNVGVHNQQDITDTVRVVNLFRSLAGVNQVTNQVNWNSRCMATASALHTLGYITHTPPSTASCYSEEIANVAANSNLYQGASSAWESVSGWIYDAGEENAQHVGHRRWILLPGLKEFGIGYVREEGTVSNSEEDTGSYLNYKPSIAVMQIHDGEQAIDQTYPEGVNFISWPSAGPFPYDHIPAIWSINYPGFSDTTLQPSDLTIIIKRQDGLTLPVSSYHFSRVNYGSSDCLVIRMSPEGTSYCTVGSTIHVQIYISKTKQCLDYSFTIFESGEEKEVCFYASDANQCGQIIERYGPGEYTSVQVTDRNIHVLVNVAEPITLSDPLSLNFSNNIQLNNNPIIGTIIIGSQTILTCQEPSQTDFIILWDNLDTSDRYPSINAGQLITSVQPKSINVRINKEPQFSTYATRPVYVGPLTYIGLEQSKFENDISDLEFGVRSNNTHGVVIFQYVTQLHVFHLQGCEMYIGISTPINNINDITNYNLNRRTVRIFACGDVDGSTNTFNYDNIVKTHKMNYEYLATPGTRYWNLKYDTRMNGLLNKVTFGPGDLENDQYVSPSIRFSDDRRKIIDFPIQINNLNVNSLADSHIYMPYITGDAKAVEYYKPSTSNSNIFIHHDSMIDDKGYYNTTDNANTANPLFIIYTSNKYDEYIIMIKQYVNGGSLNVMPEEGAEDHPVRITVYDAVNEHVPARGLVKFPYTKDQPIYFSRYKNITLNLNFTNSEAIHFIGVEKYTMAGGPVSPPSETVITTVGDNSINSETAVTYPTISIQSDSSLSVTNVNTNTLAVTSSVTTTVRDLIVNEQIQFNGTSLTLQECTVGNSVTIDVQKGNEWPVINVIQGVFSPNVINVDLGASNLRLLADGDETHLFINGLNHNNCDEIRNKVTLKSNDQSYNGPLSAVCSVQKTSIYLTNQETVDDDSTVNQPDYPGSSPIETPGGDTGITIDGITQDNRPNPDNSNTEANDKPLDSGAIAGIVVAVVVVIVIVVAIIIFLVIQNKKKKLRNSTSSSEASNL